jgi:hypothetical protein
MAGRKMAELVLSEAERAELKLLSARRKTSQALALRARIVRECARGVENREVAARLRVADGTATGAAASWRCLSKSWSAIEYGSDVGRSDQIREVADLLLETGLLATLFVKSGTANDVGSLASAVAEEAVHNGQDNAVSAAPRYQVALVFRNRLIDRQDLLGEACPQIVGSQRASAARRPSSIKAMPRRSSAIEPNTDEHPPSSTTSSQPSAFRSGAGRCTFNDFNGAAQTTNLASVANWQFFRLHATYMQREPG